MKLLFYIQYATLFQMITSEEYRFICNVFALHGVGFKSPLVKYLMQNVEATISDEHKFWWEKSRCTNKKRMAILKFLINSPKEIVFLDVYGICKIANKIFNIMEKVVGKAEEERVGQNISRQF